MSDSYDEEFIKYLELSNRAEEFTSSLGTFSQDEDEIDNVKFINPSFNLTDFVELVRILNYIYSYILYSIF